MKWKREEGCLSRKPDLDFLLFPASLGDEKHTSTRDASSLSFRSALTVQRRGGRVTRVFSLPAWHLRVFKEIQNGLCLSVLLTFSNFVESGISDHEDLKIILLVSSD